MMNKCEKTKTSHEQSVTPDQDFERLAEAPRVGVFAEFWEFLKDNKKWWMLPIILVLLVVGALVALSGSAAAPFIYTLF